MPLSVSHLSSAVLSLLLAVGMGLLGVAMGEQLGGWPATEGERLILASAPGLGALGYGFLALGLVGVFRSCAIWAMLALAVICPGSWPCLIYLRLAVRA